MIIHLQEVLEFESTRRKKFAVYGSGGLCLRSMASGNGEYLKTSMSSDEEASHSGGPLEAGATGPLLNPGPRPAAASSTGSVGSQDDQILCIKNFAGHTVSAQGDSMEGQVPESTRCDSASVQLYDQYFMSPALFALSKSLGAENKPYTFEEVWQFLKKYLFKNHHLFDKANNLFNCDDLLTATFGLKQVQFHEVRHLLGKCLRKIAATPVAGGLTKSASSNGFIHASGQTNGYNRQLFLDRSFSDQSKSYPPVHNENGKTNGESRDPSGYSTEVAGNALRNVVSCRGSNSEETAASSQSVPLDSTQSRQRMAIKDSNESVSLCDLGRRNMPNDAEMSCGVLVLSDGSVDSGRKTETELPGYGGPVRKKSNVWLVLEEDDTPVSNSDAETVYSNQGYETALCRNTEGEESEEEESGDISDDVEFEEYEIASDDVASEQSVSDNDSELELACEEREPRSGRQLWYE